MRVRTSSRSPALDGQARLLQVGPQAQPDLHGPARVADIVGRDVGPFRQPDLLLPPGLAGRVEQPHEPDPGGLEAPFGREQSLAPGGDLGLRRGQLDLRQAPHGDAGADLLELSLGERKRLPGDGKLLAGQVGVPVGNLDIGQEGGGIGRELVARHKGVDARLSDAREVDGGKGSPQQRLGHRCRERGRAPVGPPRRRAGAHARAGRQERRDAGVGVGPVGRHVAARAPRAPGAGGGACDLRLEGGLLLIHGGLARRHGERLHSERRAALERQQHGLAERQHQGRGRLGSHGSTDGQGQGQATQAAGFTSQPSLRPRRPGQRHRAPARGARPSSHVCPR